jgi:uncharacterized protein
MEERKKGKRGFASMSPEKQREIASKGGKSVPKEKRSFSQNPDLAATAGKKGGSNVDPAKRSFSQNPKLAAEAGRRGGSAVHKQNLPKAGRDVDCLARVVRASPRPMNEAGLRRNAIKTLA